MESGRLLCRVKPKENPYPCGNAKRQGGGKWVDDGLPACDAGRSTNVPDNPNCKLRSRPPISEISADSIRNCIRMSCGVAPTAFRMPISRVRSVTLTSMMFMMPMPPTMSDSRNGAQESRHRASNALLALQNLGLVCDLKVVVLRIRGRDVMPVAQKRCDLLLG